MHEPREQGVGIAVSQAHVDVCVHPQGQHWRTANSESGIAQTLQALSTLEVALGV